MPIRIAIADDHPMIINGLQKMLADCADIHLTGTYSDGNELLQGLAQTEPDVLLLDIQMPGRTGEELVPEILEQYPALNILILTNFDNPVYLSSMLRKGVLGYLLKTTGRDMLIKAIESVYAGKEFIEPAMQQKIASLGQRANRVGHMQVKMTAREKEILPLIVKGLTDKQIAEKLFLSLYTVKNYRNNLLLKLDVKNTAELITKSLKLGLIDL